MKIRIEFTKEEKNAFVEAARCDEQDLANDKEERLEGSFGKFEYDPEGSFDIDINEECVKDFAKIISKFVGVIESLYGLFKDYTEKWFDDVKDLSESEEDNKEVE